LLHQEFGYSKKKYIEVMIKGKTNFNTQKVI